MNLLAGYRAFEVPGRNPEATRRLVEELGRTYGGHPLMRLLCVEHILRPAGVGERDTRGMVRAIFEFVRDRIRFANESGEQVLTPARCLIWRLGDCDDKTALTLALLESQRIRWNTALLARRGVAFHILPFARLGGAWVPLEVSDRRARFGEDPRDLMRRVGIVL